MAVAPLCIIQARYHSTRLPGKLLLPLGGETLIARAWRIACEAFGEENTIVAVPAADTDSPLARELDRLSARWWACRGDESDLLARFHTVAHEFRSDPDDVIVRYTPDDPFKDVDSLRRVAAGELLPVERGGEAFTLAQLDLAHATVTDPLKREHITHAIGYITPAPPAPFGVWTIDTREDYEAACALVESRMADATGVPS